ncbi:thiamine-triphosphatase [Plakobranchus ocellatus]|uniref:Thiamine-triphosphatase n=1 Tax=Plakobranchus ocellatus TaxID=259542 RepID=A0AAV4DPU5_9GAST|nr:thiamine-triphosphatase [Plakobranchus ocellatus]
MSSGNQDDQSESEQRFIDRNERMLRSPSPVQIKNTKERVAHSTEAVGGGECCTNVQKTEVTIEMDGIRETTLSCSENVVSSRVRTVLDSTSDKGSVSSLENDHGHMEEGDDSAFSLRDEESQDLHVGRRTRNLSSDSHYISHTYQISSPPSPSTVSALSNARSKRFSSSKEFCIGSGCSEADEISKDLRFVDRREEEIHDTSLQPMKMGSKEKRVQFENMWNEGHTKVDNELKEKLKSAREDVQQMIECSYMVSDITDVIDDHMGSTDCSTSYSKPEDQSVTIAPSTTQANQNSVVNLDSLPSHASLDRSLSPVMTYSPGAAIRTYAMEELAERKSRSSTPDTMTQSAEEPVLASGQLKQKVFTFEPKLEPDEGTSVDAFESEMSVQTTSRPESSAVSKPIERNALLFPSNIISCPTPTTEEEEAEALDKLVDLQSIQAGYRFHDVGMMLTPGEEEGGICNLAFEDTDGEEPPFSNFQPGSELQNAIASEQELRVAENLPALADATIINEPFNGSERLEQVQLHAVKAAPTLSKPSDLSPDQKPKDYPPVSISRHFNVRDKKFETSLKSRGAVLQSESVSYNVYYDTSDCDLTFNDCWLRSQNGRWQLNANFTKLFNTASQDQFVETEDDAHIIQFLSSMLASSKKRPTTVGANTSVSHLVHQAGLREIARHSTVRRVYSLANGEKKMTVELDCPDYGFWVGKITATVEGVRDGLSKAVGFIDALWRDTGG